MEGGRGQPAGWASTPPGHPPPTRPAAGTGQMRAVFAASGAIIVLVVAIVVVVVTDDGSGGGRAPRQEIDLQAAVLSQRDIGNGYVPHTLGDPERVEYEGGPECDALIERFDDRRDGDDEASAAFRREPSLYVRHALTWLDTGASDVASLETAVATCSEYREIAPDRTTTVIQQRLPSDQLGEASVAYAQNWHSVQDDGSEYALLGFRIVWERDGVRSMLVYLDTRTEVKPGDLLVAGDVEDFVRGLAETADERLEELLEP